MKKTKGSVGMAPDAGRGRSVSVQRKRAVEVERAGTLPGSGAGQPLAEGVRAKMELGLGMDFSGVRVHEGPRAAALGALAYTKGSNIHFAPGQYRPYHPQGQRMLAHELAHVVQQAQGRVRATGQLRGIGLNDEPRLEREADALSRKALAAPTPVAKRPSPLVVSGPAAGPAGVGHNRLSERAHGGIGARAGPSRAAALATDAMPIQRIVVPTVNPAITAAQARAAFDQAWLYLWRSTEARTIYDFIRSHPMTVEIVVGHQADSNASWDQTNGQWKVEWNIGETGVVIDQDTRTMNIGGPAVPAIAVGAGNLVGVPSAALFLLHECGHVVQHMQTHNLYSSLLAPAVPPAPAPAPNPTMPAGAPGPPNFGAALPAALMAPPQDMAQWLGVLHNALNQVRVTNPANAPANNPHPLATANNLVNDSVPGGGRLPGYPAPNAHADVVEPDNTNRHERPVAGQLGEVLRFNYFSMLTTANLTHLTNPPLPAVPAVPAGQVAVPLAAPGHKFVGGKAAQLAPRTIRTHLQHLDRRVTARINALQQLPAGHWQLGDLPQAQALQQYIRYADAFFRATIQAHRLAAAALPIVPAAQNAPPTFNNP